MYSVFDRMVTIVWQPTADRVHEAVLFLTRVVPCGKQCFAGLLFELRFPIQYAAFTVPCVRETVNDDHSVSTNRFGCRANVILVLLRAERSVHRRVQKLPGIQIRAFGVQSAAFVFRVDQCDLRPIASHAVCYVQRAERFARSAHAE